MAIPVITTLPVAPSRIGDPANFYAESLDFLDAQLTLEDECNDIATYLNAAKFGVNDWGLITSSPSGGSPVVINDFPDDAPTNPPLTGYDLIIAIDTMFASYAAFVTDANAVGAYIDGYVDPAAPVVVDPARPIISSVAPTPLRLDTPTAFNSAAFSFYSSVRAFAFLLNDLAEYVTASLSGTEDWSLITITYTSTDDWGSIV